MKIRKLTPKDEEFPAQLLSIPDAPEQLYVLGSLENLTGKPMLSVVGSRKVTPYGKLVTNQLTGEVAGRGVVIVSGLALGVDALAHQAALDANGLTLAVLAGGLGNISPRTNLRLAKAILAKGGAIISEYPRDYPPLHINFIARNRLVSGVSKGVLVTEAAAKSGTMHTASFALEQGRTVMAVPGNINSPYSEGTNNLIKSGAIAVTSASDIFLALGLSKQDRQQTALFGASEQETAILQLLATGITDISELLIKSTLDASTFNQTLTMLEITGKIYPLGAGHWSLK